MLDRGLRYTSSAVTLREEFLQGKHVLGVAAAIGEHMNGEKVVITKSTVPVGTAARVRAEIEKRTKHKIYLSINFKTLINPISSAIK